MAKPNLPVHTDLDLGPLPVDAINRTLGHDLEPGNVILTAGAQAHAFRRHPHDYPKCLPFIGNAVSAPDFMGDDFKTKNAGKIELIARVPALGGGLLVALSVEPDGNGNYEVASFYPVGGTKIENRRQKGHLIASKWK